MMAAGQEYPEDKQHNDPRDNPGCHRARFPGGIIVRAEEIWCLSAGCHQRDSTSAGTGARCVLAAGALLTKKSTHVKIILKLETSKPKMSLREQEMNPLTARNPSLKRERLGYA
jgi:hypothetical protein